MVHVLLRQFTGATPGSATVPHGGRGCRERSLARRGAIWQKGPIHTHAHPPALRRAWGVCVLRLVYLPLSTAYQCMSPGTFHYRRHVTRSRSSDRASHIVPTRGPQPPQNTDLCVKWTGGCTRAGAPVQYAMVFHTDRHKVSPSQNHDTVRVCSWGKSDAIDWEWSLQTTSTCRTCRVWWTATSEIPTKFLQFSCAANQSPSLPFLFLHAAGPRQIRLSMQAFGIAAPKSGAGGGGQ